MGVTLAYLFTYSTHISMLTIGLHMRRGLVPAVEVMHGRDGS